MCCVSVESSQVRLSLLPPHSRPASSQLTSSDWSQANRAGGFSRSGALSSAQQAVSASLFVTTSRESQSELAEKQRDYGGQMRHYAAS